MEPPVSAEHEIVFDAESIRRAKEETAARIQADAEGVSEETRVVLKHVAKHLFDPRFNATALRDAVMEDGRKPRKTALREMREVLGSTAGRYIKEQRMRTAKRLLERTGLEVREIAEIVRGVKPNGFGDAFGAWEGRSPEAYRKAAGAAVRYRKSDWLTAWLWTGVRKLTLERGAMMKAALRAQRGRRQGGPAVENAVQAIFAALEEKGFTATRQICRRLVVLSGDLFEALCRRSRVEGRKDRRRGLELAELALAVVEENLGRLGERPEEYLALAWARLGNARRLASDLEGAEKAIGEAKRWLAEAGEPTDVRAEVLCLEGSLRLFQRRLPEALRILNDAVADCQVAGSRLLLVDALHQRAAVHLYGGKPLAALPDLYQAHSLIPVKDSRRLMGSYQLLLESLLLTDNRDRAWGYLEKARQLSNEVGHRPSSLQLHWLEGCLLREEGDLETAELILREARTGFWELGESGMAAIVSLELALVCYEEGGRESELRSFVSDALPALEALNLPEALNALRALRQAIAEHKIHRSLIFRVRRVLGF